MVLYGADTKSGNSCSLDYAALLGLRRTVWTRTPRWAAGRQRGNGVRTGLGLALTVRPTQDPTAHAPCLGIPSSRESVPAEGEIRSRPASRAGNPVIAADGTSGYAVGIMTNWGRTLVRRQESWRCNKLVTT